MKQTLIRRAAESDTRHIARLQQQWFEEGGVYGFVPEDEEQIAAALGPYMLVAEAAGEVVGFISGSVRGGEPTAVMPEGGMYLEIDNLYVSPGFRRQGTGSGLVTQLLGLARERGLAHAVLYSAAQDIRGVLSFYERQGFRSWYVRMFRAL